MRSFSVTTISASLRQPYIRARILGSIFILVSIPLFLLQEDLYLKLGFTSLFIGLFMIVMITERTTSQHLSDAQVKGTLDSTRSIIKELNLKGNAIFLPISSTRQTERMFIPLDKKHVKLPPLDDTLVFSTGLDGHSMGISVPPAGLPLLEKVEEDTSFTEATLDTIEEALQGFVGMNLASKLVVKQTDQDYKLELTRPLFCSHHDQCAQYPCPTCSAVLTAITRAAKAPIQITDTTHNGKTTTFHFKIQGDTTNASV
jgi:hypothetical protein